MTEIFEQDCPYYISIGMTYEQYWHGDVLAIRAYREAERIRQERVNGESWLLGMYVYDAICRLSPVLHAFAKKGTKPIPYLKKPYQMGKGKKVKVEDDRTVENERLRAAMFFKIWSESVGKKFKE